ncbi:hypothetical protein ACNKHS_22780 [Shigella flexneri]
MVRAWTTISMTPATTTAFLEDIEKLSEQTSPLNVEKAWKASRFWRENHGDARA